MKSIIRLLILTFTISGCAPFSTYIFYRPELVSDKYQSHVTKPFCYRGYDKPLRGIGIVGPPAMIVYSVGGIVLGISIVDETFQITYSIPKGLTAQLHESTLMLFDPATNTSRLLNIAGNYLGEPTKKTIGRTTPVGDRLSLLVSSTYRVKNTNHLPDEFIIIFPNIQINDKSYELPKIKFKRDTFTEFFIPMNC